jgi:hypothetical protein
MPTVAPGKVRRDWYIEEDVAKQLRLHCAQNDRKESHAVTDAIRLWLELTRAKTLRGENL